MAPIWLPASAAQRVHIAAAADQDHLMQTRAPRKSRLRLTQPHSNERAGAGAAILLAPIPKPRLAHGDLTNTTSSSFHTSPPAHSPTPATPSLIPVCALASWWIHFMGTKIWLPEMEVGQVRFLLAFRLFSRQCLFLRYSSCVERCES